MLDTEREPAQLMKRASSIVSSAMPRLSRMRSRQDLLVHGLCVYVSTAAMCHVVMLHAICDVSPALAPLCPLLPVPGQSP